MQNRVTITAFQFSQFTEEGALLLFNFKRQIKSLGVPLFLISIGIFASVALPAESEPRPLFGFVIALTFFLISFFALRQLIRLRLSAKCRSSVQSEKQDYSFQIAMNTGRLVFIDSTKHFERDISDIESICIGRFGLFFFKNGKLLFCLPCPFDISCRLVNESGFTGKIIQMPSAFDAKRNSFHKC